MYNENKNFPVFPKQTSDSNLTFIKSDFTKDSQSNKGISDLKTEISFRVLSKPKSSSTFNENEFKDTKSKTILSNKTSSENVLHISNESLYLKKKREHEEDCNNGRWTKEEHIKFVEAILKYGNEWKDVQQYVGSRSSTQARSHAQKFFLKIVNSEIFDKNDKIDNITALCNVLNNMDSMKKTKVLSLLYEVPFEKGKSYKKQIHRLEDKHFSSKVMKINPLKENIIINNKEKKKKQVLSSTSKNIFRTEKLNEQKIISSNSLQTISKLETISHDHSSKDLKKIEFLIYNQELSNQNHPSLKALKAQSNERFYLKDNHTAMTTMNSMMSSQRHVNFFPNSRQSIMNYHAIGNFDSSERVFNLKKSESDFDRFFFNTYSSLDIESDDNVLKRLCSVQSSGLNEDFHQRRHETTDFLLDKMFYQ